MLVGREDLLGEARARLTEARDGRGSILLLCGEPGVGKTRVAQEVARVAVESGFASLWGSCWDASDSPAYWPWTQLLRAHAAATPRHQLADDVGEDGPQLARIAPGFAEQVATERDGAPSADDRWRLLDSAASFFVRVAARQPLCIIVDDIHSADPSSIELLRFLQTRVTGAPLIVVATRRLHEPEPGPAARALDDLSASVHAMEIHGLAPDAVASLFADVTGTKPSDELAGAIHQRSGGNPLFVRELARLLVAQGQLADPEAHAPAIPAAVEPVIAHRTRLLSAPCRTYLEAASVLGLEFGATDAAHLAGDLSRKRAAAEATRAGLLMSPTRASGHHRFAHGIVREVIYSGIDADRRAELHRAATQLGSIGPEELLHHYERAGGEEDLWAALSYAETLSREALERFAFEEAAELARRGLGLAKTVPADDERSMRLQMALGEALNRAERTDEARPILLEAAETARAIGDLDALADITLLCGFVLQRESLSGMGTDPVMRDLLEEALPAHPPTTLRGVMLRWRLAYEIYYIDPDRLRAVADEVMAGARELGDPVALGRALELQHQLMFDPGTGSNQLEVATEICDLGREHGLADVEMRGMVWRTITLMRLGDTAALDRQINATERLVERGRLRVDRWYPALWRAMRVLLDGRVEEAEQLAGSALAEGEAQGQGAVDTYGMQVMAIRREQGRMEELIDAIADGAERYPEIPAYRCGLAMAYAESGRMASAQAEIDLLAPDDFAIVPHDYNVSVSLMVLSVTCLLLGDKDHAESLIRRWAGMEDEFVFVGYGAASGGSVRYFVGGLHLVAGRADEAVEHLERAVARNREAGAVIWTARAELALAQALADREPDRSRALLARARATAEEFGLVALAAAIPEQRSQAGAAATTTPEASAVDDSFRWDGDLWALTFETETVHVRDAKGIRDISRLLEVPGQEVHALQLVADGAPVPVPTSTDTAIDEEAARQYRDRVNELHEEIDDAEAMSDLVRAEKARAELDRLTDELTAAFGLGGRPRKSGADPAERARKAVTARVRDSIKRIGAAHTALGTHLDRSINTGAFLSYTPDRPMRWHIDR